MAVLQYVTQHQYLTFKKAPAKTALNILISTAVLISQYVDIPEFNNLTYKDELGEKKRVLFLNIPLADRSYSYAVLRHLYPAVPQGKVKTATGIKTDELR